MIIKPSQNIRENHTVIKLHRSAVRHTLCTIIALSTLIAPQSWAENTPLYTEQEVIQLKEKGTDVFYLSADLGVKDAVELMLDTGSGYLAINEKLLKELKKRRMAQYQHSINARLANGVVRKVPIYQITQLHLGQGCTLYDVEAAILSGNTRNILGLNVLKQMESFSVSFNPPRLILNGCQKSDQLAQASL